MFPNASKAFEDLLLMREDISSSFIDMTDYWRGYWSCSSSGGGCRWGDYKRRNGITEQRNNGISEFAPMAYIIYML